MVAGGEEAMMAGAMKVCRVEAKIKFGIVLVGGGFVSEFRQSNET